jgi:hypothetical protein
MIIGHELTQTKYEDWKSGYGNSLEYFTNSRWDCECGNFSRDDCYDEPRHSKAYLYHVLEDFSHRFPSGPLR